MYFSASGTLAAEFPRLAVVISAIDSRLGVVPTGFIRPDDWIKVIVGSPNDVRQVLELLATRAVLTETTLHECSACGTLNAPGSCSCCQANVDSSAESARIVYRINPSAARVQRNAPEPEKKASMIPSKEDVRIETWDAAHPPPDVYAITNLAEQEITEVLRRLERYGFVRVRMAGYGTEPELLVSLAKHIGVPSPRQNNFVGEIKLIEPKPGGEKNSGDTTDDLGLHVDGTQHDEQPAVLMFQYITAAKLGGDSVFVDGARVLEDIPEFERTSLLTRLARANAGTFSKKGMTYRGPLVRTVSHTSLGLRVRFDSGVLDIHPDLVPDLASLKERVNRPEYRHRFLVSEGDIIIFDNLRVLHARDEVFGQRVRQHRRVWINELLPRYRGTYSLGLRPLSPTVIAAVSDAGAELSS